MSTIRSVERAFAILNVIADHPSGLGVTDIADRLSLPKSTVSRLLTTMQAKGVVQKGPCQHYEFGPEPARWVSQQKQGQTLAQQMLPILQSITDQVGESSAFCILDGNQLLYQENVQSHRDVQMRDWQGERVPLHATSPGKVLLAYSEKEAITDLLAGPLTALTQKTITNRRRVMSQLRAIRQAGFSVADEEYGEGIMGMAVPVLVEDTAAGALCVYGPKFRLDDSQKQMEIIGVMQQALAAHDLA